MLNILTKSIINFIIVIIVPNSYYFMIINVIRNIQDQRFIIKNIEFFSKIFDQSNKSLNIYITPKNLIKYKDSLFVDNTNLDHNIYIYLNIDHKLVNLDFKKQYSINSFKYFDELSNSKKLDYSIEIT